MSYIDNAALQPIEEDSSMDVDSDEDDKPLACLLGLVLPSKWAGTTDCVVVIERPVDRGLIAHENKPEVPTESSSEMMPLNSCTADKDIIDLEDDCSHQLESALIDIKLLDYDADDQAVNQADPLDLVCAALPSPE
ncbi:hypothetical protein GGI04_006191, partial [Coemansia thaxteri]